MKPGIRSQKTICPTCKEAFLHQSAYPATECMTCRKGQRRGRFKPVLGPQPKVKRARVLPERFWTDWLIQQLKPFLGRKTVNVNEIILHLREQAAKTREAA